MRLLVMKTALVIVSLLTLLGVTVAWAISWVVGDDPRHRGHVAVGFGLMGLMFYSSRHGYDERAG